MKKLALVSKGLEIHVNGMFSPHLLRDLRFLHQVLCGAKGPEKLQDCSAASIRGFMRVL